MTATLYCCTVFLASCTKQGDTIYESDPADKASTAPLITVIYDPKWDSGDDIVSPVFYGMTIDAGKHYYDTYQAAVTTDERMRFMGTYASMEFNDTDYSILLMGNDNMLYYPTTGAGLGAQRAYFKIGGDGVQHAAQRVTRFSINFGDGGTTTGIIAEDASESKINPSDAWYTIGGIKLDGMPTQKGEYINNGRMIIIEYNKII